MRYSVEHKAESRRRILEAARDLFRRGGFEGASIDQVMHRAGLTRGAFYAHFQSKDDLVRQVLDIESGLASTLHEAADADDPRGAALEALAGYLDPGQRTNNATGCPLVAHPVDAIRGGPDRMGGYTGRLNALIDGLQAVLGGDQTRDDAIRASVMAIGGSLLSAACSDVELADRIEAVSLDAVAAIIAPDAGGEPS